MSLSNWRLVPVRSTMVSSVSAAPPAVGSISWMSISGPRFLDTVGSDPADPDDPPVRTASVAGSVALSTLRFFSSASAKIMSDRGRTA